MCHYFGYFFGLLKDFGVPFWAIPGFLGIIFWLFPDFWVSFLAIPGFLGIIFLGKI